MKDGASDLTDVRTVQVDLCEMETQFRDWSGWINGCPTCHTKPSAILALIAELRTLRAKLAA